MVVTAKTRLTYQSSQFLFEAVLGETRIPGLPTVCSRTPGLHHQIAEHQARERSGQWIAMFHTWDMSPPVILDPMLPSGLLDNFGK